MERTIFTVSTLCLLMCSCSKDSKGYEETLTLSENSVEFTSVGGEQVVSITANTNWKVKSQADWVEVETIGTTGNGSIVIMVQPYSQTTKRAYSLSVMTQSGGIVEEIVVSQAAFTDTPFQVYNETTWNPFIGSFDFMGAPIPFNGSFLYPDSLPSGITTGNHAWEIQGEIKRGIITINFPDTQFDLSSENSALTGGVKIAKMFLCDKSNEKTEVVLSKKEEPFAREVYILYINEDFSNEFGTFKSGWNFVEKYYNSNWEYGSDKPFWLIGRILQDFQVFIENGYRWCRLPWIGGEPLE